MHFFNPAPVLPLVEVVRTARTSDEVFDAAYAFAQRIGKEPVACNDTPGFIVNRILIPLLNDCVRVLDEARVSPGGRRPRDALRRQLADRAVRADRPDRRSTSTSTRRRRCTPRSARSGWRRRSGCSRCATPGDLGRKTGRGFYEYETPS